ncbi:tetratricopeptide repeat protein [Acidicapsa dinghuensis]|uniref:Tetratricopeptide repeat protein n=1 Tax=Acidicapsa dinghuensis TaxID=2218256 RepID=A0ABW1EKZ2_9BACT|nr:tetratricopeptide repeat protein [Acidicapsa dinghuensis]
MIRRPYLANTLTAALLLCTLCAHGQSGESASNLDRYFQQASVDFNAGKFPEAAAILEKLARQVPASFEVHELLGMVYSAQSLNDKAVTQLEEAARLNPGSAAGHVNLAAVLTQTGKADLAAQQFQKALAIEPHNYNANHDLGELYVQDGKPARAIPFLKAAAEIQPEQYDNGYDLAMACLLTDRNTEAETEAHRLLKVKDTAEVHNMLGQIDENTGKFIDSINEFQTAAHMDPSDDNLFGWGSELLLHRTYNPAVEVFQEGVRRYPKSPRMSIGLGMALYSLGKYDESVKALLVAADLDPSDPRGYLFLSKAYDSSPNQAEDVIARFRRYAELQPKNAHAAYYYAMSLWKGKRTEDAGFDPHQIQALLDKAITLDPRMPEAQLQMGNLLSDQHKYADSIPFYQKAIALDASLADAHYRLGQSYVHTDQRDKAKGEIEIYQRLRAQHLAELDRERAEVRQFIYSAKSGAVAGPQ